MDLLTFHLGDREFGVDLGRVLEILNPPPITRVPEMPPALLGLIGLRGDPTGVVDAGLRLDGWPVEVSGRTPVIILRAVVDDTSVPFGLLVEAAGRRVSVERLLPWSDRQADILGKDACIGFADLDGRLVLVLDVDRLLVFPPLPAPQRTAPVLRASAPVLLVPAQTPAEAEAGARARSAEAPASSPSSNAASSPPAAPTASARSTSPGAPSPGSSREGVRKAGTPAATVPPTDRPVGSEPASRSPSHATALHPTAPAPERSSQASSAHVPAPSTALSSPTSGTFRGVRTAPFSSADRAPTASAHAAVPVDPDPFPVAPPAPIPRRPAHVDEWRQQAPPHAMTRAAAFTPPPVADLPSPPPQRSAGRIPGLAWVALAALLLLALTFALTKGAGEDTNSRRLPAPPGRLEAASPPPAPPADISTRSPLPPSERPQAAEPVAPVEPPTDRRPTAPEPPAAATPPPPAVAPPVAVAAPQPPPSPPRKARPVPEAMRVTSDTPACEIHEVRKGDTLWWISAHRLGDPFRWPELFGENRGQIVDPDVIEIHDRIRIPGGCAPSPAR